MTTEATVKHQIQLGDIVEQLPLDRLVPAADNPRSSVGDVEELAASIRSLGVLEPLVAQPAREGFYDLVFGHRRLAAAKLAGLATVPVLVRAFTEAERLEAMLVENLQRSDLTPIEEARAFKRLVDLHNSQRQVAKRIGCSQAHVSRRLALLELPASALEALEGGAITVEEAVALTKLTAMPDRLDRALAEGTGDSPATVGETVRAELDDQARLDRIEQLRRELDNAGVRLLDWPSPEEHRRKERPLLDAGGWPGRPLSIEPAEHTGELCHAAAIDPDRGTVVYLCTDPARHAQAQGVEAPGSARRSRGATGEAARAQREATRARREFISRALVGRLPRAKATELALRRYLEGTRADVARLACGLLGVRPDVEGRPHGRDYRAALEHKAGERGCLALVAHALALAQGEVQAGSGEPPAVRSHLEFLQSLGYEPTAWEQEERQLP